MRTLAFAQRRDAIRIAGWPTLAWLRLEMHWEQFMADVTIEPPDEQAYLPRLSGAGSLRRELEAVLEKSEPDTTQAGYRQLILEENAAEKRSASMRTWTWKRLKVRYLLDPGISEFRAFRASMDSTHDPTERGLLTFLMMARTDRLFRDVFLDQVTPHLAQPGTVIDPAEVRDAVEKAARDGGLRPWSESVIEGTASHLLSACKDFGLLDGSKTRRIVRVRIGASTVIFALRLGRLEGLSDRRALESRWFGLFGLRLSDVLDLMHRAARSGALGFRFQADIAEIVLPEVSL